jgi:biotin operon repressor
MIAADPTRTPPAATPANPPANPPFLMFPKWLLYRRGLRLIDKVVWIVLRDLAPAGVAWPSLNKLALELSVHRETVLEAIRHLEADGLLRIEHRGNGRGNRYHVLDNTSRNFRPVGISDQSEFPTSTSRENRPQPVGKTGNIKNKKNSEELIPPQPPQGGVAAIPCPADRLFPGEDHQAPPQPRGKAPSKPKRKAKRSQADAALHHQQANELAEWYRERVNATDKTCGPDGRASKNAEKLLNSGKITFDALVQAVDNYHNTVEANGWLPEYRTHGSNFFGRAAVWCEHLDLEDQELFLDRHWPQDPAPVARSEEPCTQPT